MTATQIQLRRDTATNINNATPANGEPAWNLTDKRLQMGDGLTAGGIILPNAPDVQRQSFNSAIATGTPDALIVTLAPVPGAWVPFLAFDFMPVANNTGPATVTIAGLAGTKVLKKKTIAGLADLDADDLVADQIYRSVYNGAYAVLDAVHAAASALAISQGDLNTSTGAVSISGAGSQTGRFVLPGGEYGFCPTLRRGAGGNESGGGAPSPGTYSATFLSHQQSHITTSYVSRFYLSYNLGTASNTGLYAQQRYIAASPPFDLGDGPVGGFIFALVNAAGDIVSHYAADVPPWAYNGPTDIRATRQCKVTGKKFRRAMRARSIEEIMDGAAILFEDQEITHAIKNADMSLIPHPFGDVPDGHTVVLLDPMDDRVACLIDCQNAGVDFTPELAAGKFRVDNEALSRCGPPGVTIHKMAYRYSGKKRKT